MELANSNNGGAPTNWVGSREVRDYLGIKAETTLARYIKDGLPVHKLGKRYLFDLVEVSDWVRMQCGDICCIPGHEAA